MHALIDADIFCYEIGSMKNPDTGVPLPWGVILKLLNERIFGILDAVKAESWQMYLTGKGNFRVGIASILPYKEHRGDKPFWYQGIYNYLRDHRRAIVVQGYEADDAISMEGAGDFPRRSTCICTRDKDLRQVSGYHYGWASGKQPEFGPTWISELDGWRNFFSQCLTGDAVDNILGLYQVGKKAASVRRVHECTSELEMFRVVKEEYEKRFGSYWDMFLYENGTLLWMLRSEKDSWFKRQKEFTERLNASVA